MLEVRLDRRKPREGIVEERRGDRVVREAARRAHLGIEPSDLGQIGGGRNKPTGVIDVAMIQSLARRDDPTLFDRYGYRLAGATGLT